MPELPEVETTLRGIEPHIAGTVIEQLSVYNGSLRWPVTEGISEIVKGQRLLSLTRRAKYLLLHLEQGSMMIHLGMSGSLRLVDKNTERRKHDHIEMHMSNGKCLRYHDPRRFGAWLWSQDGAHPQLDHLGPEPLTEAFNGKRLFDLSRQRKIAVKPFIMDNKIGGRRRQYLRLRGAVSQRHKAGSSAPAGSLGSAIKIYWPVTLKMFCRRRLSRAAQRLRDFVNGNGEPGYFQQTLAVYGRGTVSPALAVKNHSVRSRLGQRSSVFCAHCQR